MKKLVRLTNIKQLTDGVSFHCTTTDGQVISYDFLCIHPHNENYIIAINRLTANGDKIYIPNLFKEEYWVGKYDSNFFTKKRIEYHERMIKFLKQRLSEDNEESC